MKKKKTLRRREKMQPPEKELVRIKRSGQVTVPLPMRNHLKIREGGYLEATLTDKGIILRPVRILLK